MAWLQVKIIKKVIGEKIKFYCHSKIGIISAVVLYIWKPWTRRWKYQINIHTTGWGEAVGRRYAHVVGGTFLTKFLRSNVEIGTKEESKKKFWKPYLHKCKQRQYKSYVYVARVLTARGDGYRLCGSGLSGRR